MIDLFLLLQLNINLPILFLLSNVNSQWLRIIVQNDAAIKANRVLQLIDSLEFDIAESLELIRVLVLDQSDVLHRQLAEDLNHVSLDNSLRQVADKRQKRWLCWQWLLVALVIVVPAKETKTLCFGCSKSEVENTALEIIL